MHTRIHVHHAYTFVATQHNGCDITAIVDVNEKLKVIREDVLKLTEVLIDLQQKQISEVTDPSLYV